MENLRHIQTLAQVFDAYYASSSAHVSATHLANAMDALPDFTDSEKNVLGEQLARHTHVAAPPAPA